MGVNTQQYWDEVFRNGAVEHPLGEVRGEIGPALRAALEFFGPMQGKTIIDLGCGDGATSLFFAKQGAKVVTWIRAQSRFRGCGNSARRTI